MPTCWCEARWNTAVGFHVAVYDLVRVKGYGYLLVPENALAFHCFMRSFKFNT